MKVRLVWVVGDATIKGFNPRTREGATVDPCRSAGRVGVSIHAPVKVRHNYGSARLLVIDVSIHAPVKVRRTGLFWFDLV